MAAAKPTDSKLIFIKVARGLSYFVYALMLTAVIFLSLGFVLLLFGANSDVSFTRFVYKVAAEFLQPFRGIFPPHQITETSYLSTSALFAIMVYTFVALGVNTLIAYVTAKMVKYEDEIKGLQK